MSRISDYLEAVQKQVSVIAEREEASIRRAAVLLADQVQQGHLIHVAGTGGHSYLGAEEMTWRAGGLVQINPIFEPGVSLSFGATRSGAVERVPGLMQAVLSTYDLHPGEVMIIVNAYGINSATIDTALEARRLGLTTIGITGTEHPQGLAHDHPSRHPSGKGLYELVDLFINTYVPLGDAVVQIEGFQQRTGPVSTIANSFAINCLVAETVQLLVDRGVEPAVWKSANSPGGNEWNDRYERKYRGLIRYL